MCDDQDHDHHHDVIDAHGHVHEGELRRLGLDVHRWGNGHQYGVSPRGGPLPTPMYGAPASGLGLAGGDDLGCDLIHVKAGGGFSPHTHPGDHLLVIVRGRGTVTWDGRIWPTEPGLVYYVPGESPHAVGAIEDHTILAVGSPHKPVGSADRQALTAYASVASSLGTLTCLACQPPRTGTPERLREAGCIHAPDDSMARRKAVVVACSPPAGGVDPVYGTNAARRIARAISLADHDTLRMYVDAVAVTSKPAAYGDGMEGVAAMRADSVLERTPGRVAVVFGPALAVSFGGTRYPGCVWLAGDSADPTLMVFVTDAPEWEPVIAAACTMAAGGPPAGRWSLVDVEALAEVGRRVTRTNR